MINLNIPHLFQMDNELNPSGSCNVSSVAMALKYYGIKGDGSFDQLEDQLYQRCTENDWSRHSPYGLKQLIDTYANSRFIDKFTEKGTITDIKNALDNGVPCIVHGYFTRFGHIIVIRGYDENGFFVNDPYGEYFSTGYNTSKSGENLHYSYDLIMRTCSPESPSNPKNIYLHRVVKR